MNVWLVGGDKVIPTSVENAIKGDGYTVKRINGSDRYETAKLIAEAGADMSGKKPSKVFVASGESFADALAVSPVAYAKHYAIVLTEKNSTSDFSKKALGNIGTDSKILVGGEAVVSESVAKDLTVSQRISGDDRAVTANLVADWAKKSEGFTTANAALVGGTNGNGADSLVAASVLGKSSTTLHFAGWDATSVYLKDHSAELSGKGFVFGGTAAVTGDQVSKAQASAQYVSAATSFMLTAASTSAGSFSYIDANKKTVSLTVKSTDKFVLNGAAATYGAFKTALSVGDMVSVSSADSSGNVTYTLTDGKPTGLVKAVAATTIDVVEPTIGAAIGTAVVTSAGSGFTYVYKVDGVTVDQPTFQSAVSVGDSVSWSDVVAGANTTRTIVVTSASLSGVITSTTSGYTVKTSAGLSFLVAAPTAPGDVYTIDGVTKTQAQFVASGVVTVGDKVTYSKTSGISSWALINAAPAATSGVVSTSGNTTAISYLDGPGHTTTVTFATDVATAGYKVNGAAATQAEFLAAATPGSAITFQPANPDDSTSTGTIAVTTGPLSGTVSAANSTAHTVTVSSANGDPIAAGVSYASATSVFASGAYAGSSLAYTVDGSTATVAQFDSAINSVQRGAKTATVTVSLSGGVATWALATSVNPNATVVSGLVATTANGTVVFNRPVGFASGVTALANTDVTVSAVHADGTTATVAIATTGVSLVNGQVVITWGTAPIATDVVTVNLTQAGANKLVDSSNNVVTPGTVVDAV